MGVGAGVGVGIDVGGSRGDVGRIVAVVCAGGDFVAVPHPALVRDRTRKKIREMVIIVRIFDNRWFSSNTLRCSEVIVVP
jgi:hypothetical protein